MTAHLYRWTAGCTVEGELLPYEEHPLELEPKDLLLRWAPATTSVPQPQTDLLHVLHLQPQGA